MFGKLAIGTLSLFLLLGTITPAKAEPGQQETIQAQRNQSQKPTNRPTQQRQPATQRQQPTYGSAYHGGVQPNGKTHGGVHHSGVPQEQAQVRSGFLQSRANSWNSEHRSWSQRGGYQGFRVPEDRYRNYFGVNNFFNIYRLPMVFVGGYPRFQYDGYWVTFVDPWPESWGQTWFETDDVYILYTNDGYYLYNRSHPGISIAVNLSL